MNDNLLSSEEVPVGLGMALAQNLKAMKQFTSLSRDERQAVIDHTHTIQSKEEMQQYVDNLWG